MGEFDIPAMIDTVLKVTHQEKLFYVGHSMGTTGLKFLTIIMTFFSCCYILVLKNCQDSW